MRNTVIFAIAIISMVTASCSVKEEQVITKEPKTVNLVFEATNEGEASSKTVVQSDGSSVWWSAHESINIFYGASASSMFTSTNDTPVAKAQFSGNITAFTGETEGNEADYFWGVYPYNALNTCDGSSITATLSGEQTACAGSFADNQWLTLAKSQGLALSFRAVCAGFRFSVTKSGVKSVTFRGNNNEVLAGKARIGMDGNNLPTVLENITEVREITLSAPSNGTLEVGTMYYMTFYPTNFTSGFTVTFNTETETATRVYSTAKNFARTQVHIGANFDSALEYTLIHPNNEIWYTTHNGNLYSNSYITNWEGLVSNTYSDGKGILVFEDDLVELPQNAFNSVSHSGGNLTSISLPASIQIIRNGAFNSITTLSEIVIPHGCSCEEAAFGLMDGLQRIIGENVSEDGRLLIENNTIIRFADAGITSYEIPNGVTRIGTNAFSGSLSLTSITIPPSVSEIGYGAFYLCNNLSNIVFSNSIGVIPNYCFYAYGSKKITSIQFPTLLEQIGDNAFSTLKLTSVIIPSTVTYIGENVTFVENDYTVMDMENVRVLAPNPPTLKAEHAFGRYTTYMGDIPMDIGTRIKVPASSVALYKADPKWSKYYIEADSN